MKKKLRLSRETLRHLAAEPLDRVAGGDSLVVCSAVCGLTRRSGCCDTGDTLMSCNLFSCASCIMAGC